MPVWNPSQTAVPSGPADDVYLVGTYPSSLVVADTYREKAVRPAAAKRETFSRGSAGVSNALTANASGTLRLQALPLVAGDVLTGAAVLAGSVALSVGVNQHFSLWSPSRVLLKATADDTSTAWSAETVKSLGWTGGTYVVPTTGLYYLGILIVATTRPNYAGLNSSIGTLAGVAPILTGTADAGLTDPASLPSTATTITATQGQVYGYVY